VRSFGIRGRYAQVWDLKTGDNIKTLNGHNSWVNAVSVTPDGRCVVSASGDDTLKVWDMEAGNNIKTFRGHTHKGMSVSVTPNGRRLVSASSANTLKVWDIESGVEIRTLKGHTGEVNAVSVTPDSRYIVSVSGDNTLKVWDMESGRIRADFYSDSALNSCAISSDGETIVAGEEAGKVAFSAVGR